MKRDGVGDVKNERKQCKWKNLGRQGWQDICTANFNYEHWPLSFYTSFTLSPLSNWPTGLVKEGEELERQMAKKKPENLDTTLRNTVRQSRWTQPQKQKQILKQSPLPPEFAPVRWASVYLSLFLSLHIHCVFILSLLCSLSPFLLTSVFHFKLEWWDPNLNGCWAKSETTKGWEKEGQTDGKTVGVLQYKGELVRK